MSLQVDIEKKLKDITLRVAFESDESDGISGILGASGCGKSMTLKCIAGIETPDRGRIVLNGRVLYDSEKNINIKVQERNVGYLFQNYALFPNMTVRENVEIAVKGTKEDKRKKADEYLEMLQVMDLADRYPKRLSGGQQQRVALARILVSNPDVLMLDEPFSALDYFLKETLQLELLDVLEKYQGDILMVTHSREEIYRFCEIMHVLNEGKLVASGKTDEVFTNPQLVATAKLTGCKNIVEIKRLSDFQMEVVEWQTILTVSKKIPKDTTHIGIRAHDILERTSIGQANQLKTGEYKVMESPFEITVVLENGIWWVFSKDIWKNRYHEQVPEYVVLPQEGILYLH